MLDRDTSPRKDSSASLKNIHGHDHSTYQYLKIPHVFIKSFVCHSTCTVFTILFVGSLSSFIPGLSFHYLYLDIKIFFISYIWSFPYDIKRFNLSMSMSIKTKQRLSVIEKWRQVSTKKCLKINLSCKRNFYPRYLSKYIYQTFISNKFSTSRF